MRGILLEATMLSTSRIFGEVLDKGVYNNFRKFIKDRGITNWNEDMDKYLIDIMTRVYSKMPDGENYNFIVAKDERLINKDKRLQDLDIINIYYDTEDKEVVILFEKGFSKNFMKDGRDWNKYKEDIKALVQHELVHSKDFRTLSSKVVNRDISSGKGKISSLYDVGGLNTNRDEHVEKVYVDVLKFCNNVEKSGLNLNDIVEEYDKDENSLKRRLVKNYGTTYKDKESYEEFLDIFKQHIYSLYVHKNNPSERRALSQEIIIDFLKKGLSKQKIGDIIKGVEKVTPSPVYNGYISLFGASGEGMLPIRYELGKRLLELPSSR